MGYAPIYFVKAGSIMQNVSCLDINGKIYRALLCNLPTPQTFPLLLRKTCYNGSKLS